MKNASIYNNTKIWEEKFQAQRRKIEERRLNNVKAAIKIDTTRITINNSKRAYMEKLRNEEIDKHNMLLKKKLNELQRKTKKTIEDLEKGAVKKQSTNLVVKNFLLENKKNAKIKKAINKPVVEVPHKIEEIKRKIVYRGYLENNTKGLKLYIELKTDEHDNLNVVALNLKSKKVKKLYFDKTKHNSLLTEFKTYKGIVDSLSLEDEEEEELKKSRTMAKKKLILNKQKLEPKEIMKPLKIRQQTFHEDIEKVCAFYIKKYFVNVKEENNEENKEENKKENKEENIYFKEDKLILENDEMQKKENEQNEKTNIVYSSNNDDNNNNNINNICMDDTTTVVNKENVGNKNETNENDILLKTRKSVTLDEKKRSLHNVKMDLSKNKHITKEQAELIFKKIKAEILKEEYEFAQKEAEKGAQKEKNLSLEEAIKDDPLKDKTSTVIEENQTDNNVVIEKEKIYDDNICDDKKGDDDDKKETKENISFEKREDNVHVGKATETEVVELNKEMGGIEINTEVTEEVKTAEVPEMVKEEVVEKVTEGIKEETKDEVVEETKEEVKDEVVEKTKEDVKDEVIEETKKEVTDEVAEETKKEVTDEVIEETKKEVKDEVDEETNEKVTDEVAEETKKEVTDEVVEETKKEVKDEVVEETKKEVKDEVDEEAKEKVTDEVIEETKKEVTDEVTEETKEKVTDGVAEETKKEVPDEVIEEKKEKVPDEVVEETKKEVTDEVAEKTKEEVKDEVVEETKEETTIVNENENSIKTDDSEPCCVCRQRLSNVDESK